MKFSDVELPSNRNFGYFFTVVFFIIGAYVFSEGLTNFSLLAFGFAALLFLITLVKADLFLPLNKLWMILGLLIGKVVSPIVIGIIFFGLFTPLGFFMRLFGRDELRLKLKTYQSYWKVRETDASDSEAFKQQF